MTTTQNYRPIPAAEVVPGDVIHVTPRLAHYHSHPELADTKALVKWVSEADSHGIVTIHVEGLPPTSSYALNVIPVYR